MRSRGFVFYRVRHTEYISGEKKKEVFPDLLFCGLQCRRALWEKKPALLQEKLSLWQDDVGWFSVRKGRFRT